MLCRVFSPLLQIPIGKSSSLRSFSSLSKYGDILGGSQVTESSLATFKAWHSCVDVGVKGGNVDDAVKMFKDHVAEDVKFYPPTYFARWEGRDEFLVLISQVGAVFGSSFKYDRQWLSDDGKEWCLEFKAEIEGDKKTVVDGVDLVKLNDKGEIVEFRVLARPPNAVEALKATMMRRVPGPMARMKAAKGFSNLFGLGGDSK
ncbi:hypothetical protein TrRE_jg2826 [Triparma retinervis]|uniref:SnoaL-like domain-containing protein n=1 Tax=Triparma retinervis TaxID=2557542 RepID=A0A9W7AVU2_9STRA|nr:hypothetical protein TrRE_jg2826 [Triparma retinervis]